MCVQVLTCKGREKKEKPESWSKCSKGETTISRIHQNQYLKKQWMENFDSHFSQYAFKFSFVLTTCLWQNHMVPSFEADFLVISIFYSITIKGRGLKIRRNLKIIREKLLSCWMVIKYSNGLLSKVVESTMYWISALENFNNRIKESFICPKATGFFLVNYLMFSLILSDPIAEQSQTGNSHL